MTLVRMFLLFHTKILWKTRLNKKKNITRIMRSRKNCRCRHENKKLLFATCNLQQKRRTSNYACLPAPKKETGLNSALCLVNRSFLSCETSPGYRCSPIILVQEGTCVPMALSWLFIQTKKKVCALSKWSKLWKKNGRTTLQEMGFESTEIIRKTSALVDNGEWAFIFLLLQLRLLKREKRNCSFSFLPSHACRNRQQKLWKKECAQTDLCACEWTPQMIASRAQHTCRSRKKTAKIVKSNAPNPNWHPPFQLKMECLFISQT